MLEPLFNNVVGLKVCKFIKIRLNTGVFLLILRSLKLFEAGKPLAVAPGVVGGWSPLPCSHVGRACKKQPSFEEISINFLKMLVSILNWP